MPWQPSMLLFPDAEIVMTARLRAFLNGRPESYATDVYVSNRVPSPRRDRMVIVRRDGGTSAGTIDRPRLSFRVWAPNEKAANDLARLVVAWLKGCADGTPVVRVESPTGPTPVADESEQSLRYITADVHMRASDLT